MSLEIHETSERDLHNIKSLWADGDVMKFVGFPNGLQKSAEEMAYWYQWIVKNRPRLNHYSIYLDDEYCGETFYKIDTSRDLAASMDIKLFAKARGKGVATRALSYAIEQAFLNGASKVWVDPDPCNHKALALYERLGFAKCEIPAHLKKEAYKQVYMEKEENKLSES